MSELIELSNALAQVTDHAAASVVVIHSEARGSSSGVVWREGAIVTAEHALRRDAINARYASEINAMYDSKAIREAASRQHA